MRKSIIIFIVLFSFINCKAQSTFEKFYPGAVEQYAIKLFNTSDKGFLLVGTSGDLFSYRNTLLIRTDSLGDTLWTKRFGNDTIQYLPYDACTLPNGNILITGDYQVDTVFSMDSYIQEIDTAGNEVMFNVIGLQSFQGGAKDHGEWVRTLDNGTIIVAGYGWDDYLGINNHHNAGTWLPSLSKLDANGNLVDIWSVHRKITATGGRTYDMETIGNKIYWLGTGNGSTTDIGVFDENLDSVFSMLGAFPGYHWMSVTKDNCLLLYGKGKIAKMDTLGNILWSQTNSSIAWPYDMVEKDNGDYILLGMESLINTFVSFTNGGYHVYLDKFSSSGILTGSNIIDTTATVSYRLGYSIVNTPDNGYAIGGFAGKNGNVDTWLYKSDSISNFPVGLNENLNKDKTFYLFPNPSSSECKITSEDVFIKIEMYNSVGMLVFNQLVNCNSYQLKTSNFAAGIYQLSITQRDGKIIHRKLMIEN